MIFCDKERCKENKYIGESERSLKDILGEHKGYIKNRHMYTATGYHFNQPGHDISNMTITILEKVKKLDANYRKEREKYHIRMFNTYYRGMNRMP